jgi:serine/threonine protein kinase
MDSPTKKRKARNVGLEEENRAIISSKYSLKSRSDNSSKAYSPSIHKKRISKAEEKKMENARKRFERLTLRHAANRTPMVLKPKTGEIPEVFSEKRGGMKYDLVLKRTSALEVQQMLKKIKKKRNTRHIAFTKAVKELGDENVEIYKRYDRTLDDEIKGKKGQGLDLPTVAKYLYGILDGVASFHKAGYIHGDLKPNNIVISSGIIKLIDYDMSHKAIGLGESTANKFYAPSYLLYPQAADFYSVGSIFIEMLFGTTMKNAENEFDDTAIHRARANIADKYKGEEREMILDLFKSLMETSTPDSEGRVVRAETLLKSKFFRLRYKRLDMNENAEAKKARKAKAVREKRQKAKESKKKLH